MKKIKVYILRHKIKVILLLMLLAFYYFCLPKQLFHSPTATVIESREGELLGAKIATDGQWRFPKSDSIPYKFQECIRYFEDEYFYKHPGFNPISIFRALEQNIRARRVVRGGSTLTQQVIRLSRKGKKRSYFEKAIELILATRLEFRDSKKEILKLYSDNAPFGGNVVGLEMAAWRYFGQQSSQLSWAESATLAVLPNTPSLIYPGKNQQLLLKKRNRLLRKLVSNQKIDSLTYQLALAEELPKKPFPLPRIAPHLLEQLTKKQKGDRIQTTIDLPLQLSVNTILKKHYRVLKQNEVHNAAVLVMDVKTRQVLAYVGNTPTDKLHEKDVDMIRAFRSTGSVLKPLLYAAMLDGGELLPESLVADVPTQIAGYSPENFNERYDGAVTAKKALSRSLNIPAVRMLQSYGLGKFRDQLRAFRLGGITKSADYYGLPLILGGAETSLWDLCKTYASLAATLNNFNKTSSEYFTNEFTEPVVNKEKDLDFGSKTSEKPVFDAASIYLTFEAMKEVNRPEGNEAWEFYDSSKQIAWKTGTSFGNKDSWSIGVTRDYVVGVWVGNADGEGRPNITGVKSAAPILFDVFDVLPRSKWFQKPLDAMIEAEVCTESGNLASPICPVKKQWITAVGMRSKVCKYHKLVHLDINKQFRVNASCEALSNIKTESWFVLPPLMEYYYKRKNPRYKTVPAYREDCFLETKTAMEFIYPKNRAKIALAKNFDGQLNDVIIKLAHYKPATKVFWYLDERFIKQTESFHEIGVLPSKGWHVITVVDELGNERRLRFEVL